MLRDAAKALVATSVATTCRNAITVLVDIIFLGRWAAIGSLP
jgi:hypothetical protein